MAKNKVILTFSLVLLLGFNGCIPDGNTITTTPDDPNNEKPGEEGTFAGLSAETERQMKLDFFRTYLYRYSDSIDDHLWTDDSFWTYVIMGPYLYPASTTADEVQIYYYFGNYNGYEVAAFLTGPFEVQIGNMNFKRDRTLSGGVTYHNPTFDEPYYEGTGVDFPQPAAMLAWKPDENSASGHFYAMQEAYNLGLLTRADMQSMHDLYYYDWGPFEDLDEEEKVRIAAWFWDNTEWRIYYYAEESFEDLDEERKNQMVFNFWNSPYGYTYLGTYHDYVILSDYGGWDAFTCIQVYDFVFCYPTTSVMYAWHKGNGYAYVMAGLPEYKEIDYKDFLTAEDVKSMWERYIQGRK